MSTCVNGHAFRLRCLIGVCSRQASRAGGEQDLGSCACSCYCTLVKLSSPGHHSWHSGRPAAPCLKLRRLPVCCCSVLLQLLLHAAEAEKPDHHVQPSAGAAGGHGAGKWLCCRSCSRLRSGRKGCSLAQAPRLCSQVAGHQQVHSCRLRGTCSNGCSICRCLWPLSTLPASAPRPHLCAALPAL